MAILTQQKINFFRENNPEKYAAYNIAAVGIDTVVEQSGHDFRIVYHTYSNYLNYLVVENKISVYTYVHVNRKLQVCKDLPGLVQVCSGIDYL